MSTCRYGHPRSPESTYVYLRDNGRIMLKCRVCARLWARAKYRCDNARRREYRFAQAASREARS